MKKSQWVIAAVVMAGLISIVTYAMNYLGSSGPQVVDSTVAPARELVFGSKYFPPDRSFLEREERTRGYVDFWFHNPNEEVVQIGLDRKSCKCGSVEVCVLPEERRAWIARTAAGLLGVAPAGGLEPLSLGLTQLSFYHLALHRIQEGIEGQELLKKTEKTPVPPGQVGWVRLHWSERKGKQTLEASMWFDNPVSGKLGTLGVALYFHEPLRVRPLLEVRTALKDADLQRGVRESILVWSSTRHSLHLEASPTLTRDDPKSDPFVVGEPVPLTHKELLALAKANNEGSATMSLETRGSILCAYRIPITLLAVAADGTPFDSGPFRRGVNISSPDVNGEPKTVFVMGRVRSVISMGIDGEGGGINFRDFSRSRGKVETLNLECYDLEVKLALDRKRTAKFLDAELVPVTPAPTGLQAWTLRAKVLPDKADGEFPRSKDPFYEDSAIYLSIAASPGKPARSIRVPVYGRATGR